MNLSRFAHLCAGDDLIGMQILSKVHMAITFRSNKIMKFSNMREFNDKLVTVCFKLSLNFADDLDDSFVLRRLYQIMDLNLYALMMMKHTINYFSLEIIHFRKIPPNL